jgi:hypothetical protein
LVRKIEIERFSLTTSKQFDVPKIVRLLIGNELIMKEMAKHVADAGSYAPVTVLVDEPADGVHFSYDKMTSLLAPYENREALEVARDLDRKFEDLLRHAATARRPSDGQAGSNPKVRVADDSLAAPRRRNPRDDTITQCPSRSLPFTTITTHSAV